MALREAIERNTESTLASLNAIKEFISSNIEEAEQLLSICSSLKEGIKNQQCQESILVVHTLSSVIQHIKSGDATQVVIGAMKILPVLSTLQVDPKSYGNFTNDITHIASALLSIIWKNEDVQKFLASDSGIRCCSCWQASDASVSKCSLCFFMKHKTAQTIQKMKISNTFLTTLQRRNDVGEIDLSTMMATIGINLGSSLLLILHDQIQEKLTKQDISETKQLLNVIEKYALIAFLRGTFLLRVYSMFILYSGGTGGRLYRMFSKTTLPPAVVALQKVIEEDDRTVKSTLDIFINPPYRAAFLLVHFDPSSYPLIAEFLKNKGWEIQNLTRELNNTCFHLCPKNTPNICTVMSSNPLGTLWGTFNPGDYANTLFRFSSCSENNNDNFFHIKSEKYSWYVIMGRKWSSARGTKDIPGEKGEWKVIRFEDGTFMMCTKQCLGKFIYMKESGLREVKGHYGDLGECAHWLLTYPTEEFD